jgi:hypothetical protein
LKKFRDFLNLNLKHNRLNAGTETRATVEEPGVQYGKKESKKSVSKI